jgi:hypothetical protein
MATKIPTAAPDDTALAADELAVLHPDRALVLGGRAITLREYGFFEGLDVADRASAFIADLVAASGEGSLRYAQVRHLFGRHRAVIPVIAAQAGDVEVGWLDTLAADDLELYLATWFATNAAFFVREVLAEVREAHVLAAGASVGMNSSSDLLAPDSAPPISLADAPSAS